MDNIFSYENVSRSEGSGSRLTGALGLMMTLGAIS